MKRYSKILITVSSVFFLGGCLKDTPNVDFSGIQPVVEISTSSTSSTKNAPAAGLAYFSSAVISLASSDDLPVTFTINLAAKAPLTKDITVTYGINDAQRTAYNAAHPAPTGVQFDIMPDSVYSFTSTSGVIHAGQNLDTVSLVFYRSKIDPTKNYMLPITITDAQGVNISGNFNTMYFHTIGNPIAAVYEQEWIRYNTVDQSGTPAFDEDLGTNFFAPDNPTQIEVQSGTGVIYLVSFENDNGVLSNFQVAFPTGTATGAPGNASIGITITGGPTIITADPVAGIYEFNFTYLNSSGAPRNITDKFVKQ